MGITRKHMNCLDIISVYFKIENLIRVDTALLNQSVAANDDEEFPFGVMSMLAFCDARLAYVDADLATVKRMYKLSKRTSIVNIHFQRESNLILWQIT